VTTVNYAPWSRRAAGYLVDWGAAFVPSATGPLLDLPLWDRQRQTIADKVMNTVVTDLP